MKKAYLDMIHWKTTQKTLQNQSHLADFFWKLFQVQRKRRGQLQLIVNWEVLNTRFSDGSVGLCNSNQSFAILNSNTGCGKEN
jgi:hypothetical protein